MTNTFNNEKIGSFKSECKIINLKYEYEGYTGKEKWAIITALSEEENLILKKRLPYSLHTHPKIDRYQCTSF